MARLNIDYKRTRNEDEFRALTKLLGSEGEAWDRYLRFLDLAQDWYAGYKDAPPRSGISERAFALAGDLECMIEVGYAERRKDGIHAKGDPNDPKGEVKRFGWLLSKKKGGKARADSSRNDDGTFAGQQQEASSLTAGKVTQQTSSSHPACAGQELDESPSIHPASSSLSLSFSQSNPPLSPPDEGKAAGASRRDLNSRADDAAVDVLRALYEKWEEPQTKRDLTTEAQTLVACRYGKWANAQQAFSVSCRSGDLQAFEHGLRRDFRAAMPRIAGGARPYTGPPTTALSGDNLR